MTGHLSSDGISEYVAFGGSLEAKQHVESCAECRAQAVRLQSALAQFRDSASAWSAAEGQIARTQYPRPGVSYRLALAGACAVLAIGSLIGISVGTRPEQRVARDSASDAALLRQIDTELSREAPSPMEPLTKLVSWEK